MIQSAESGRFLSYLIVIFEKLIETINGKTEKVINSGNKLFILFFSCFQMGLICIEFHVNNFHCI